MFSQAISMEQHQVADGGNIIRTQKRDNRINKGHDLSVGRLSDMAGDAKKAETDDVTTTAASTPSATKSANSSPACQELTATRSVERFVYETDKPQSVVIVQADTVSNSLVMLSTFMCVNCILYINYGHFRNKYLMDNF